MNERKELEQKAVEKAIGGNHPIAEKPGGSVSHPIPGPIIPNPIPLPEPNNTDKIPPELKCPHCGSTNILVKSFYQNGYPYFCVDCHAEFN